MLGYIKKVQFDVDGATITFETQDVEAALHELLPHRREQTLLSVEAAQQRLPLMPQTNVVRHSTPLSALNTEGRGDAGN